MSIKENPQAYFQPTIVDPFIPLVGTKWRHYKGGEYEVIGWAKHTEDAGILVLYQAVGAPQSTIWARPEPMWDEIIRYDDNSVVLHRFTFLPI